MHSWGIAAPMAPSPAARFVNAGDTACVTRRRNPATQSRHIPASFAGAEGPLERDRFRAYFDALTGLSWGAFFDGGGTRGSRYDGPVSSRQ
jgi:hypothetical protein